MATTVVIQKIGEQGPQGVQGGGIGSQGLQGPQGATSFDGPSGDTGYDGIQGAQGFQAFAGYTGIQGVQYDKGPPGFYGFQGSDGSQGRQGRQSPVHPISGGVTLLQIPAIMWTNIESSGSINPATDAERGPSTPSSSKIPLIEFNYTATESAETIAVLPPYGTDGTLKAKIWWCSTGTGLYPGGYIVWTISIEKLAGASFNQAASADGFATANTSSNESVPATNGEMKGTVITLSNTDSIEGGWPFRIRLSRPSSDTHDASIQMAIVEIYME